MIRANIDPKLELKFRELAMKRFGYGKGALSRAVEEAILRWIATVGDTPRFEGDPVEAIDGILADVEAGSVELQHRIKELWISLVAKNVSS